MNKTQHIQHDMIDLRELVTILLKRKTMIVVITVLLTLFSIIYAYVLAKPIYTANALLEVGQIAAKPIDNINILQQKLAYMYKVNGKRKRILPYVEAISIFKKSKTMLSLVVYGHNNEEATKYCNTVIQDITTLYQGKIGSYIEERKKNIALIDSDITKTNQRLNTIENELKQYTQRIITLEQVDAALAGIYTLLIGQSQNNLQDLSRYLSELKNKKLELELSITPLMIKPTHIVGEIGVLDKPIKPQKILTVIVTLITALIFSILLAFFLEFFRGFKKEND